MECPRYCSSLFIKKDTYDRWKRSSLLQAQSTIRYQIPRSVFWRSREIDESERKIGMVTYRLRAFIASLVTVLREYVLCNHKLDVSHSKWSSAWWRWKCCYGSLTLLLSSLKSFMRRSLRTLFVVSVTGHNTPAISPLSSLNSEQPKMKWPSSTYWQRFVKLIAMKRDDVHVKILRYSGWWWKASLHTTTGFQL